MAFVTENEDAMSKRLLTLRQIQAEKFPRSRSWIFDAMKEGSPKFPQPIGGCVPNLWEEDAIDKFVEDFVAAAKGRQASGQHRIAKASATLASRRAERRVA